MTQSMAGGPAFKEVTPEQLLGPLNSLELKHSPDKLFIAGPLTIPLAHPRVAIIGTRSPSAEGLRVASELAAELSRRGVTVVSGLARGIDTAAHNSSIAAGGRTLAVLGTPLCQTYPPENRGLQLEIMTRHLAVTQFAESTSTRPGNFVRRNRTMALIADASVIVESGEGGGSLNQGWETLRLGRPLFIHVKEFEKKDLEWPGKMARFGAIRFRDPSDVLDQLTSASPGSELAVSILEAT
jgi:DNA processing protein